MLRFTELKKTIDGISQRMLTVTLRQLERDGLVRRTVHPVVPPRVDYELTPLGVTLHDTIQVARHLDREAPERDRHRPRDVRLPRRGGPLSVGLTGRHGVASAGVQSAPRRRAPADYLWSDTSRSVLVSFIRVRCAG